MTNFDFNAPEEIKNARQIVNSYDENQMLWLANVGDHIIEKLESNEIEKLENHCIEDDSSLFAAALNATDSFIEVDHEDGEVIVYDSAGPHWRVYMSSAELKTSPEDMADKLIQKVRAEMMEAEHG